MFIHPQFLLAAIGLAVADLRIKSAKKAAYHRERWKSMTPERRAEVAARNKAYRNTHRVHLREKDRLIRYSTPDRVNKRRLMYRRWRLNNRERHNAYYSQWVRNRVATDPAFALRKRLSVALHGGRGFRFMEKSEFILGIGFREFMERISAMFKPGMSFDNQGEWHLAHRFPASCAGDDLQSVGLTFRWENFKPEWGVINQSAQDKLTDDGVRAASQLGIRSVFLRNAKQAKLDTIWFAKALGLNVFLKGAQL